MAFVPSYLSLYWAGELQRRASALERMLAPCLLCPHDCGNDRLKNEIARCHTGALPIVSSATAHFGEEPPLSGTRGVGNIFFGNCNCRCVYCQNFQISQNHRSQRTNEVTVERLAATMLELQEQGVHSIGLVSPTHVVPQIVRALTIAVPRGLSLPLIYNTNAYDAVGVLRLLDGIIDIYLPDLKYSEDAMGIAYSRVPRYPIVAREAVREMHRQVGSALTTDEHGLVQRGLIIRHLVLPNDIAGSKDTLRWIAGELGAETTVSVMAQYYPVHKATSMPLVDRRIREGEYERVLECLAALGMDNGWVQEYSSAECYRPQFENRNAPFTGGIDNCTQITGDHNADSCRTP
jgi:putative pyruvate formate lyase activating enzyme